MSNDLSPEVSVKRYDPYFIADMGGKCTASMERDDQCGDWVRYEDYESQARRVAELERERDTWKDNYQTLLDAKVPQQPPPPNDHQAETITNLCDRLERINKIAHGGGSQSERLGQIQHWSDGFMQLPAEPTAPPSNGTVDLRPLRDWAQYWSSATARTPGEIGWKSAAEEVQRLLKPVTERATTCSHPMTDLGGACLICGADQPPHEPSEHLASEQSAANLEQCESRKTAQSETGARPVGETGGSQP